MQEKASVSINLETGSSVGYSHYYNNINPIKRLFIKNLTDEDLTATITLCSEPQFIITKVIANQFLPRKSAIRFESRVDLSPLYLSGLDYTTEGSIICRVEVDGKILNEKKSDIKILSFNECNFSEDTDLIAGYVRSSGEVNKLISEAKNRLISWNKPVKENGYLKSNINDVRFYFASSVSILSEKSFTLKTTTVDSENHISDFSDIFISKVCSEIEMSMILASMIEGMGYNALIAKIDGRWLCGVWLVDDTLNDVVSDDIGSVISRAESGVNNIATIFVEDIFKKLSYDSCEKSSLNRLKVAEEISFIIDIKRARLNSIKPLPERIKNKSGYDLIESKEFNIYNAPKKIVEYKGAISSSENISRKEIWERRLLDLDMRNSLLNFKLTQNQAPILNAKLEDFIAQINQGSEYSLSSVDNLKDILDEKTSQKLGNVYSSQPLIEQLKMEFNNKRLRLKIASKDLDKTLKNIYRKENINIEETGVRTLFLAVGFLKWTNNDNGDYKYAPLILYPINLIKKGISGNSFSLLVSEDEVHINNSLLEFLYQEFGIDMRGLNNIKAQNDADRLLSVIARIRKEIVNFKGWNITDDVFLAQLSFASYLMWNDVNKKFNKFLESKVIRSLLSGVSEFSVEEKNMAYISSDGAYGKEKIYLPISADSSQYSAIQDSLSKSFVLHGPPGTGKSQTITNIIANNILRGRRVLFVAEKLAALSVVYKRLKEINLNDFCLDLYSSNANKTEVATKIMYAMQLSNQNSETDFESRAEEISNLISKLQGEMVALHKKRSLGISIYEGVLKKLANDDAPNCLRIDSMFYEKLNETSLKKYEELLENLSSCVKECGTIAKSPFKSVGYFDYSEKWLKNGRISLIVYLEELKHLKAYAKIMLSLLEVRTTSLNFNKLKGIYEICNILSSNEYIQNYYKKNSNFQECYEKVVFYENNLKQYKSLKDILTLEYNEVPNISGLSANDAKKIEIFINKCSKSIKKDENKRAEYSQILAKYIDSSFTLKSLDEEMKTIFGDFDIEICVKSLRILYTSAETVYINFQREIFDKCVINLIEDKPLQSLMYYNLAYQDCLTAKTIYEDVFNIIITNDNPDINDVIEDIRGLYNNLDLIPNWCKYNQIINDCKNSGLDFVIEPIKDGELTSNDILKCFRKSVYNNFITSEIALDDKLCQFSGITLEDAIDKFKSLTEEYERLTKKELYMKMISKLPKASEEGEHNLEMVVLSRAEKSGMKGYTIRKLFEQIPTILKSACPCMLMSPSSVTQYLDIDAEKFDLVVFDEASQLPTSEALGAICRSENIIVVGDPKQLPPTTFFNNDFRDEENYDKEDLDSILDDCLAIGMPERHLLWHYRSRHESLIAFSNAMFYDNKLLTFPSPNELNSKVSLKYIDGVYDRGVTKRNKKEAENLVADVISRLKDPLRKVLSIGVVTFSTAQQNYIEDLLMQEISKNNLEDVAINVQEPIFVKNLENVQGDERDVILFSVGYGPDSYGRLSLNFGPLNQAGGFRRLNVAVTRARAEMIVYSSITSNMIDLSRTDSKGVKGLKAFLEYAEKGREMLTISSDNINKNNDGIGMYIARDLKERGFNCDYDVGVSDFKIDVAVLDPRDKTKYLLAIICDSENSNRIVSIKDRVLMQSKILKQLGWNTYYLWTVNYLNNPKREINKIKEYLANLSSDKEPTKKSVTSSIQKYKKNYKSLYFKPLTKNGADYILAEENFDAIKDRIDKIIKAESPIEEKYLTDKILTMYNILKTSKKAVAKVGDFLNEFSSIKENFLGYNYYREKDVLTLMDYFRPYDPKSMREIYQVHPYEIISSVKCYLENKVVLKREQLIKEIIDLLGYSKKSKNCINFVNDCIKLGIELGALIESVDDTITI